MKDLNSDVGPPREMSWKHVCRSKLTMNYSTIQPSGNFPSCSKSNRFESPATFMYATCNQHNFHIITFWCWFIALAEVWKSISRHFGTINNNAQWIFKMYRLLDSIMICWALRYHLPTNATNTHLQMESIPTHKYFDHSCIHHWCAYPCRLSTTPGWPAL
jgi:hypothetical protein